jgi:hypothetical protein
VVIGNTLFVHGAADARSLQYVPSHCERDAIHELSGTDTLSTHTIQQVHEAYCTALHRSLLIASFSHRYSG